MRLPLLPTILLFVFASSLYAEPLPGTQPLTAEGDLAAKMVAGIDKYLMRELAGAVEKRQEFWKLDYSRLDAVKTLEPYRERLKKFLGVVDARVPVRELEYVTTPSQPSLVADAASYQVHAVRWPVFPGVDAEGLLLEPKAKPAAYVVALPDADQTPEMLVGLAPGLHPDVQFARRLAENGCRVLIPALIDRKDTWSGNATVNRFTNQPHREFLYRMAFELGRHALGYELQKVLAAVDWFTLDTDHPPIGVVGYGEGGLLASHAGAIDPRIRSAVATGYFGPPEDVWQLPIYRNLWSVLRHFGGGEASLYTPKRALVVEHADWPRLDGPPAPRNGRGGAAPGKLATPTAAVAIAAWDRGRPTGTFAHLGFRSGYGLWLGTEGYMRTLLAPDLDHVDDKTALRPAGEIPKDRRKAFDPIEREKRQFEQLVNFSQRLLRESESRRQEFFWSKLRGLTPPTRLDEYEKSTAPLRDYFWEQVIGKLPAPTEPMNARTRQSYDEPKWKGYEVTLDLYPDVFAYGILLVPKDLKPGEKRPVVVCQHGLEGRPQDVVNPKEKTKYYNSFGAQLADRGYIVYAPQNPYIGHDKFRVLQRKANPLGLSIFSFIVRQHERTLDWLATLPFVDPQRMAFYGLSYGGKTAMRVPAILPRYCLSICSGDFNEWIWKNCTIDWAGSYMFTGEYEMPEFDLGNTFNYAEMAALIAPRPFMVERGHDDGVGLDEWVGYEYAKVRRLYDKLGIGDRTAIEFFNGGHMINGKGTFEFLDKHLKWGPK
jgi:dienelactone hydrolase